MHVKDTVYTFNHLNISWFHLAKYGSFMHPLDHAKLGLEVQAEQAQIKTTTNLALDQGKPWCI
jgi:hypothetical protein